MDIFDPNDRTLEDALGATGALARHGAQTMTVETPQELAETVSKLDAGTARAAFLFGVLLFKAQHEGEAEFAAFLQRAKP